MTSLDDYKKILDHFQSQGYNEIDTARVYVGGKQEAFTREAGWKERGLTVATKWYPSKLGLHKEEPLMTALNKSLEELGTDCVDIFYLHAADRGTPVCSRIRQKISVALQEASILLQSNHLKRLFANFRLMSGF